MRSVSVAGSVAASVALLASAPIVPGLAPHVAGQSVIVEVTAAESGAALAGAFVSLLDDEGGVVRSGLTEAAGRFVVPVGRLGTFRVRAELIGRESGVSAPFTFREGDEGDTRRVALSLASHAIPLAEIRVEVEERCRLRPDEASELQRVWDEARKAITVQAWAEGEGLYRLDIATYERDLDADGRRVEREQRQRMSRVSRVPFASLPPEELARSGFVRRLDDGGHQYFGPDARLLLSDQFLDTHCFRLTRSADRPGTIGLAFEPVSAGEHPDIRGTLWVDEQSAELGLIEYRYTRAPYEEAEGIAGGRVEFEALPNGAWIVERWRIRAPLLARDQSLARAGDSGIRVIGIQETGGEVTGVSTLDRRRVSRVATGSVRGVVWDSTASAPLAGARVWLSGTAHETRTDDEGRFVLDELPDGVFTATFSHERLDSLGLALPGVEAEVTAGRTAELALAVPSRETILIVACRAGVRADGDEAGEADGGAVVSGIVRARGSGEPIPGASVRLEWQQVERMAPIVQARAPWIEVRADEDGRYTACGMPVDEAIRVRPAFLGRTGEAVEIAFDEAEHRVLDLEIELPRAALSGAALGGAGYVAGAQGVQGTLTEHDSGRPVRSAEVTVRSGSGAVLATGVTDESGFFRLEIPRPGRFLLSARALGYAEVGDEAVDVQPEKLTVLEIGMVSEAFELEPIVVTVQARSYHLEMEGFYRRDAEGFGVFIPPELFERRPPRRVSDHLYGVSGVYVAEPTRGDGGRAVYVRSGLRPSSSGPYDICWPMVYVDHHLVSTGGLMGAGAEPAAIDDLVNPADVLAMEVYRSPAEVPSEFHGPNAGCGVVVLWTRRGGGG